MYTAGPGVGGEGGGQPHSSAVLWLFLIFKEPSHTWRGPMESLVLKKKIGCLAWKRGGGKDCQYHL